MDRFIKEKNCVLVDLRMPLGNRVENLITVNRVKENVECFAEMVEVCMERPKGLR